MCMGNYTSHTVLSEERAWNECQVGRRAMLSETSAMSGDVGFVFML